MLRFHWAKTRPASVESEPVETRPLETETPSGFAPSSMPMQTDEVREISREVNELLITLLRRYECRVLHVDFRRRLSTKQYRAYITVGSRIGLDTLYATEDFLRTKINDAKQIEIAGFYWKYRPAVSEERS